MKVLLPAAVAFFFLSSTVVLAHTPLCSCFDNGDNTITCEGGFSDGSSASGVALRVKGGDGKVLVEGKMSKNSDYTFERPKTDFTVVFDAGEGHQIEVAGKDIAK